MVRDPLARRFPMNSLPLHWKLALLPAASLLGLVLLTLWIGGHLLEERLRTEAASRAEQSADLLVRRINRTLDRRVEELQLVAGLFEFRRGSPEENAQSALDRALRFSPYFVWLGVRDGSGAVTHSTGEPPSELPVPGANASAAGLIHVSGIRPDARFSAALHQRTSELYLDFALDIRANDGSLANVAGRVAWRNIEVLRDDQRDDDPQGGLQRLVLIADGSMRMGDDLAPAWRRLVLEAVSRAAQPVAGTVVGTGKDALLVVPASLSIMASGAVLPWQIYAVQDLTAVEAPVAALSRTVLIAGVAASLCLGVAGYALGRRLVRPYRPFLEAIARRVREQPAEAGQALTRHLDAINRELDQSPQRSALQVPATDVLAQLVESAQRLGAVLEQVPAGVLLLNPQGFLAFSNRSANDILKLGAEHRQQQFVAAFRSAGTRDTLERVLGQSPQEAAGVTLQLGLNDGSSCWCQLRVAQLTDGHRAFQGLLLVVQDVSDEVRSAEERQQYQEELRLLTHRLLTQEKLTTARLAQALHDQLGQTLAALNLCVEAALRPLGDEREDHPARLARHLGAQAVKEVRQVLIGLRPPLLDEQGLAAALDNEVALQSQRHPGLDILAEQTCPAGARWPADVEYAAFMVAREALSNALRHAAATVVRITLTATPDGLELEVEDDGQGMSCEAPAELPGHYGLIGMRERASAVGAHFHMRTAPRRGVVVMFTWPAPQPASRESPPAAGLRTDNGGAVAARRLS